MEINPEIATQFLLRKEITFLNFGSFGACPRPIFEEYQRFQLELETEPVQFITVNGLNYLTESRIALAKYLHCEADELVFMTNPSFAVNTVAKSLHFEPEDVIWSTSIEYGACDKTWDFICEETGAKYIRRPITLPISSSSEFIDSFFAELSPKTKLIFISHITSATGLILPVEEICRIAHTKGILTFVDGAHAPGHIPLDLHSLGADFYTGACHKWMLTPKGCSFLYASKKGQDLLKPLVVSWGYKSMFPSDSLFLDHHQMNGTRDYSAFLTIPKALDFLAQYQWETVSKKCHKLGIQNLKRFCNLLNTFPLAPLTAEFFGQLFSIPIRTQEPEKLQRILYERYSIEIPVMRQASQIYIRYSIQVFNSQADLDHLYASLQEIIAETNLIQTS